ncbi:MAG: hypothetical protein M0R38_12190 [Bacteroidia bacterium]|nr:hypothetical protein [Bacteroidia bacterium]
MVSITTVYPNDGEIVFSDNSDCIISAEREDYITIVTDLLFAYLNKDSDFPHEFERKAVKNALEFLSAQGNVQYKITDFFDDGDMES